MSGIADSVGGFLGLSSGPKAPGMQTENAGLGQLNTENGWGENSNFLHGLLDQYSRGEISADDLQKAASDNFGNATWAGQVRQGLGDSLATGSTTGSKYATEQVMNSPMLGSLFGQNGQLNKATSQLDKLNNQGFQLQPEDMTMYGQASGNIARMFGAQGNQMSQDLASRGLAAAPSGAAGAMFSGLAGNQNEQLANAQQQIMQQRFQNSLQQAGQLQNYISQLGGQGQNAIQNQYGRQLAGAQNHRQSLTDAAGLQNQANAGANQANMAAANYEQQNKPQNFMDMQINGMNTAMGAGSKTAGQGAAGSMFTDQSTGKINPGAAAAMAAG